jgi:hypothetical protein
MSSIFLKTIVVEIINLSNEEAGQFVFDNDI